MIGRRIYYDVFTGEVLVEVGEKRGDQRPTTIEQDIQTYKELSERNPGTFGVLELEYGQYAQDFRECNGYKVDVSGDEPTLVFSYPDPNEPEAPPVYRKPLSEEMAETKQAIAELTILLAQLGGV